MGRGQSWPAMLGAISVSDIILIDFDAIYWRHWHTTKPEDSAEQPAIGAVAHVRRLRATCNHAIVCVDAPRTWRHELSPTYKSSRAEKPPHAIAQRRNAIQMLEEQGFRPLTVAGFESDDVIASACKWALSRTYLNNGPTNGKPVHNVIVATMDKDLHQLVGDRVKVLTLDKGEYRGPEYVRERYGIGPELLGDWLALVGDASDTIAGVPGVGPKTATSLLQKYGSLLGILEAARDQTTDMTPRGRSALLDNQAQLALARKLVTLRDDLAIDWASYMTDQSTQGQGAQEAMMEDEDAAPESEERPAAPEATKSEPKVMVEQARPKPAQTTALATIQERVVRPTEFALSLEPMTHSESRHVAKWLCDSRLFQQTFATQDQVYAAIMIARSHGLPLMQVLMPGMVHSIKGKISMSAQMIVGLVLRSGKAASWDCIETTSQRAVFATQRVGSKRETQLEFTIEEARAAGYLGKPDSSWQKTPKTMLRHRCETELARLVYPDVVGGLYTPQEFEDAEARPERAA